MPHEITIEVKPSLHKNLLATAALKDISLNEAIEDALVHYVEMQNYKLEIAQAAYSEMKTEKAFISEKAMMKWIKSWGSEKQLPPPEPDVFR